MKCKQAKQKMFLRSEGRLNASDAADLECHLESCPDCRVEADMDKVILESLAVEPDISPREGGWERLRSRIELEQNARRIALWKPAFALCAVVLLMLVLVNWFAIPRSHNKDNMASKPQEQRMKATLKEVPAVEKKPRAPEIAVAPKNAGDVERTAVVSRHSGSKSEHLVKRESRKNYRKVRRLAYKPAALKKVDKLVKEPSEIEQDAAGDQNSVPANDVTAQAALDAPQIGYYSAMAANDVTSEMGDLISEGMSVLLEVSEEFSRPVKEKQL